MPELRYTVTFRLSKAVYDWLYRRATKEGASMNALVVALIERRMEEEKVKA